MFYLIGVVLGVLWLYLLHVLKKSKLNFWHFALGSAGLFIFMMVYLRQVVTQPLARVIAAIAGIPGNLFGIYTAYFKYGIIFVQSAEGAISLMIDFECSGVIEIMAFISLLLFYNVYTRMEKVIVALVGISSLILANAIRITLICVIIHFMGVSAYYVAHAFIGRIVFYAFSVALYFYVFTKPQIIKQRVGGFNYASRQ